MKLSDVRMIQLVSCRSITDQTCIFRSKILLPEEAIPHADFNLNIKSSVESQCFFVNSSTFVA